MLNGPRAIRGDFLIPDPVTLSMTLVCDNVLEFDQVGRISCLRSAGGQGEIEVTLPGCLWTPGWIDTHVHYPQIDIRGSASGPLLPWLEETVFPEEAKFRNPSHAQDAADRFVDTLLDVGTTTSSVYGASDPKSTELLFSTYADRGLRGLIGMTLMDTDCPQSIAFSAGEAIKAAKGLAKKWHGYDRGRLQFAMTPRFALSCSSELMRSAGALAHEMDCLIQTHMAENQQEIEAVRRAFPQSQDYLGVYEDHGLAGARTLFAHCIWLNDDMWDRMKALGCAVSHCPDSNFFLGSGQLDLEAPLSRQIPTGLGSDVGAGRTFDMRRAMSSAFDTVRVRGKSVTPQTLVWLASRGGALALGLGNEVGCLSPGFWADLVAWRLPTNTRYDVDRICEILAFCHDMGRIESVYVSGRQIK